MNKKFLIIKSLIFTLILSATFTGYGFLGRQECSTAYASTTATTKSNEITCKKTRYVTATSLNVRKSASAKAKKVTTIKYRTKVTVIATIKDSSWVKVSINGGKTEGYVNSKYLSSKKPAKKDSTSSDSASNNSGNTNSDGIEIKDPDVHGDGQGIGGGR